jgi:DNA-binding winged helix-turn-helix (wHTH) protein
MRVDGDVRLRFGKYELDSRSGKLLREGRPVKIQPQPLRVLGILAERPGEIVSREQLRDRIWGDATFVEFDQGLNYCIRQIRNRCISKRCPNRATGLLPRSSLNRRRD